MDESQIAIIESHIELLHGRINKLKENGVIKELFSQSKAIYKEWQNRDITEIDIIRKQKAILDKIEQEIDNA